MRKNNRYKVLETARLLFPKYGLNGISLRMIAKEADMTTGAIYFHFKNKEDIYKTICSEAIDMLLEKYQKRIKEKNFPGQKLIAAFDIYMEFYNNNRDYYNILLEYKAAYEFSKNSKEDEIMIKMNSIISIMEDVVQEGIKEGRFRDVNSKMLSLFLFAVTEGFLQHKKIGLFSLQELREQDFRKFMSDLIGRGIQKED